MSICKLIDFSKFPDCSALNENGRCTRLNVFYCQGEKCSFKRTSEEDKDSIKYAYQRISRLDSHAQSHIAKKYFRGTMPWK